MLAKVSQRYGLGRVVAVDPHNFNSAELQGLRTARIPPRSMSFQPIFCPQGLLISWTLAVSIRRACRRIGNPPFDSCGLMGIIATSAPSPISTGFCPIWFRVGSSRSTIPFTNSLAQYAYSSSRFCDQITLAPRLCWVDRMGAIPPDDGSLFQNQRASLERLAAPLIPFLGGGDGSRTEFVRFSSNCGGRVFRGFQSSPNNGGIF